MSTQTPTPPAPEQAVIQETLNLIARADRIELDEGRERISYTLQTAGGFICATKGYVSGYENGEVRFVEKGKKRSKNVYVGGISGGAGGRILKAMSDRYSHLQYANLNQQNSGEIARIEGFLDL